MRVLALANLYRPEHVAQVRPYRTLNPTASSWNRALFAELARLDLDLDVVQFWPVRRRHTIQEGRARYHYLPRVPWIDGFSSALKRARVAALVRQLAPDVIHGIGSEHGHAWAAVGHGVPSVVTIHGYLAVINRLAGHSSWLRQRFLVSEERRALLGADRVIAINGYMRDRFVADGCDPGCIDIVPNALDPVFLQDLPVSEARPIDIIMVGTLHRLKNQHLALELLARLAAEHGLRPKVVIVGAGTSNADSKAYVAALRRRQSEAGLAHVQLVGRKSPTELAELYRQTRFLLHISEFETDSLVVAEALACGVLPVVNPVASLAHRVRDGINGWHLPITDPGAAVSRLATLLGEEGRRSDMVSQARVELVNERRGLAVATATSSTYFKAAARAV